MNLDITYIDSYLVAINKPHGLLVHRSRYANESKVFAVQELRNQIGQYVYPCHRIDRKTSGVLLFALDEETNSKMQQMFANKEILKKYLAIVRGFTPDEGIIDYPLVSDKGKKQEAITAYKTLQKTEISIPFGKFNTSRYSLIEVSPETGRMHQIRKHFAHIFHPIIGDRPHGCNKQNRLFKEKWDITSMMLHANELCFLHPITNESLKIKAPISSDFQYAKDILLFT